MQKRQEELPHESTLDVWTYERGTHFVFPQRMIQKMLPVGSSLLVSMMFQAGRKYPKECKETRIDIDQRLREVILSW